MKSPDSLPPRATSVSKARRCWSLSRWAGRLGLVWTSAGHRGLAVVSGRVDRNGLAGRGQAPALHAADARVGAASTRRSDSSKTSVKEGARTCR